ncbi:DUF2306 domain-containing protein [Flammeovirgaceae bacterium SG7u.111]|nr:DUF2306 domain-containing protein [Flammeovirgaceae bacterium SG7u.132]WPO34208.1 DUF2306 domain-containing protein [Flammeovirgaceae bacterium SG7u.111]
MNQVFTYTFKTIYYASLVYFTYLMMLITLQYIPLKIDVAFLNVKEKVSSYTHYQWAFFSHVYTSIFVLIFGIPQFSKTVRNSFPIAHKLFGKAYILLVLFIASPSGLIMAYYANGGIFSRASFIIQAVLWFAFTYKAFTCIRKNDWENHQKFMLRSYALTLSAISLRLIKWIMVSTLELPPMDTYKIVAWLGWMINLILVEVYLMSRKTTFNKKSSRVNTS